MFITENARFEGPEPDSGMLGACQMDPSAALARETVGAAWNGTQHMKGSSLDIH